MTEAERTEATGDPVSDRAVSWAVLGVGAAVVAFLTAYNAQPGGFVTGPWWRTWEEYLVVNTGGLLLLPWLTVLTALRAPAARFGWRPPSPGTARVAWAFLAVMLPVVVVASRMPEFRAYYPMQPEAAFSWRVLIYAELAYGFYMFAWEWFYRGFLTLGMERGLGGTAAVLIQAGAFGLMHWGKPPPELVGSFAAGIALGWLALRTRSFLPGFWLHWTISVAFDLLCIRGKPGALF